MGSEAGDAPSPTAAGPGGSGLAETDSEREQLRRELLLGHLLTLSAGGGAGSAVPPHALPAVAASLAAEGLIPKWLAWSLAHQPALFDRAFQRVFAQVGCGVRRRPAFAGVRAGSPVASHSAPPAAPSAQEVGEAGSGAATPRPGVDPAMAWAVCRFWKRRPAASLAALSGSAALRASQQLPAVGFGALQGWTLVGSRQGRCLCLVGSKCPLFDRELRCAGGGGGAGFAPPPGSRYEADFTELRRLGRGGYGIVVSALNRMDGR